MSHGILYARSCRDMRALSRTLPNTCSAMSRHGDDGLSIFFLFLAHFPRTINSTLVIFCRVRKLRGEDILFQGFSYLSLRTIFRVSI